MMNNLVPSSPTNVNQSHNSAIISDCFDRSLDQLTIEIAERPSKKRGLRSKLFLRPSMRSKVENAQHSPSGKEKPLQTAANGVPSPYTRDPVRPLLAEHPQSTSELGNESSTNLAEPMKHPFNPLKLVTMKRRDSTRSTAGKATSSKSRPQTPVPSDPNGTPETSFGGQLGPPQSQTPLSDPTLPRLTSKSAPPVLSIPPTKAARSPIPQRPLTPPFDPPPPPRLPRKSVKQIFNPLKLVTMKQKDSTRHSAGKAGSTKSRPQTPALSHPNGTPKTSFVPPSLPGTHVQRTPPHHPQDSAMPSSPAFDPRSSTYQYIRSAIDFSDPSVPDLNFLGGFDIETTSAPTEQEVLDHGGDVEDTHGYEYEENEEEIVGEEAQSGHERSRSFSVLTRTLSEASRGALAMFGTGGAGDGHRKLLRKQHQRTDSTPSNETGAQETMGGTEKGVLSNLREEIMTNDGLEDDGDRVSTDERKAILTDSIPQNSSLRSTSPTSQQLSAFLTHQSSFCLNSPPRSPAPISRRTASPPLFGAPVLPQAPTITTTALPPTEDATRSISVPSPPPSPSGAQTISSILFPIRKHLTTHRVSQSNGSTAGIAATASPNTDRSDVLCNASPQSPGSAQPPHASAIPPPLLPVLPQPHPSTSALSSKSRFPTFGVAGGTPTSGSISTLRERDRGGFRIGQDFLGLKKKLKWIRKKDSGNVSDAGSVHVVKSSDWEYAAPVGEVPSNSAILGGVKAAVPSNLSEDEIPPESIQMPVPTTMPPDPRASSAVFSGRDNERLDLGNQHLGPREWGFYSDSLQRSNATSGERNSKAMVPARSSMNTVRASLASSNGSGLTTPVDEDNPPWTRTARAAHALRPPSPQAPTFLSVTPVHRTQALHPMRNRGDVFEKEKAFQRSRNIPFIDVTASRSIRTGLGTASSTAWSDKGESPVATTKASSERAAGKSFELEDGEFDRHYGVHRYDGHPIPPIQHPREPDLAYTPTSAEIDEIETILRPTLDDLACLYVPPSRLTKLPSREIGLGRYGEVFLARWNIGSQTPTYVAVKELRPVETRAVRGRIALRMARELKIWAKVNHPNVLRLIGYYLSDNYEVAQFISPYMTNGNVADYLKNYKVDVLARLDITNILINGSFRAVLCDFGLASLIQESGIPSGLTTSRTVKGSLRYMSPELYLEDDARHTLASDAWAWGCTAFEIVTDCVPYQGATNDAQILRAVIRQDPPGAIETLIIRQLIDTPMDVVPVLSGLPYVLQRCWSFEPRQRPQMRIILHMLCPDYESPH